MYAGCIAEGVESGAGLSSCSPLASRSRLSLEFSFSNSAFFFLASLSWRCKRSISCSRRLICLRSFSKRAEQRRVHRRGKERPRNVCVPEYCETLLTYIHFTLNYWRGFVQHFLAVADLKEAETAKQLLKSLDTPDSKIRLLHNDALVLDGIAMAGTRGWSKGVDSPEADKKILNRELIRLETSLKSLENLDYTHLIIMTHFPVTGKVLDFVQRTREMPENAKSIIRSDSRIVMDEQYDERFWETIKRHTPTIHVFGHVHNKVFENPMLIESIRVYCLSADAIDFDPVTIEF
jgi:predicted phosphohydrolase